MSYSFQGKNKKNLKRSIIEAGYVKNYSPQKRHREVRLSQDVTINFSSLERAMGKKVAHYFRRVDGVPYEIGKEIINFLKDKHKVVAKFRNYG